MKQSKLIEEIKEELKKKQSIYDLTLALNNKQFDSKLYHRIRYNVRSLMIKGEVKIEGTKEESRGKKGEIKLYMITS